MIPFFCMDSRKRWLTREQEFFSFTTDFVDCKPVIGPGSTPIKFISAYTSTKQFKNSSFSVFPTTLGEKKHLVNIEKELRPPAEQVNALPMTIFVHAQEILELQSGSIEIVRREFIWPRFTNS